MHYFLLLLNERHAANQAFPRFSAYNLRMHRTGIRCFCYTIIPALSIQFPSTSFTLVPSGLMTFPLHLTFVPSASVTVFFIRVMFPFLSCIILPSFIIQQSLMTATSILLGTTAFCANVFDTKQHSIKSKIAMVRWVFLFFMISLFSFC
jgi:hypothetical protein